MMTMMTMTMTAMTKKKRATMSSFFFLLLLYVCLHSSFVSSEPIIAVASSGGVEKLDETTSDNSNDDNNNREPSNTTTVLNVNDDIVVSYNPNDFIKEKKIKSASGGGDDGISGIQDEIEIEIEESLPEPPKFTITDIDPNGNNRTNLVYTGSIHTNSEFYVLDPTSKKQDIRPKYVESFLGIRYAKAYKRFDLSSAIFGYNYVDYEIEEIDKDDGLPTRIVDLNAIKKGPACVQYPLINNTGIMNEDCLYLNIWKPSRFKETVTTQKVCNSDNCTTTTVTKTISAGRWSKKITTKT
jgi:hypothetical protein